MVMPNMGNGRMYKMRFLLSQNAPTHKSYQANNTPKDYDPLRNRKLLLHKSEIIKLGQTESTKGLTIVPLSVYNMGRVLKVDLGIAKGKKQFDKRETIKKRDTERDIQREL